MTSPVNSPAQGERPYSASEGKASPSEKEAAQRMADTLKEQRGFDVAFDGPDLIITADSQWNTIHVDKQMDGALRVQAEGYSGYYDILPDVREVTIRAQANLTNEIFIGGGFERPFRLDVLGGWNTVVGGDGNDDIVAQGLENRIFGRGGGDVIIADGVSNQLEGGDGDDRIEGGKGEDSIFGGAGDDTISAREGNDRIEGGKDKDSIFGGTGDDTISGEEGNDLISGEEGNDTINGDDGNDGLFGGGGRNLIYGGAGNDHIIASDVKDTISGGAGDDTVVRFYPKDTEREATVEDTPDEGSTAYRSSSWWDGWFMSPDHIYEERKK